MQIGIFPAIWLVAAALGAVCLLAELPEVLLSQWILATLYLLSLMRLRRHRSARRKAREEKKIGEGRSQIEQLSADRRDSPSIPSAVAPVMAATQKAGDCDVLQDISDELQAALLHKFIRLEQRKRRLQVSVL